MASVSSSSGTTSNSFINSYGIKNKGIGGLLSGLDTESLVEALTAGTRAKIAKQQQDKTLLNWKRTAYRGVATSLTTFQDSVLKLGTSKSSADTCIASQSFFNTFKGNSTSSKVALSTSTTTAAGTVKIDEIRQMAEAEKLEVNNVLGKALTGKSFAAGSGGANFTGQTLQISLDNGSTKTIKLDSLSGLDGTAFQDGLQSLIDVAVGTRSSDANPSVQESIIKVELDGSGALSLTADRNSVTIIKGSDALGIATGATNRYAGTTKLVDVYGLTGDVEFKINGTSVKLNMETNSINDLVSKINSASSDVKAVFSSATGKITFSATKTGSGSVMDFEDVTGTFAQNLVGTRNSDGTFTGANWSEGKNAEIVVDGKVVTSSTNVFDIGGIGFEVSGTHAASEGAITLSSTTDTDKLVEKIQTFVDTYNGLLISLNSMINEKKDSDYTPLTDEQKAEMTESQISAWETEAKKGLLQNDSTLRRIVSDLRTSMLEKVEAAGLSLYDIGIAPASYLDIASSSSGIDYTQAGKLTINEDRLRSAIENNLNGVRTLFTDSTDGIAARLNTVIDKAAKVTVVDENRGSLVRIAGSENYTGDYEIGDKIDRIDKYITTLKTRLEAEYTRQWKKFTALETALQKLNTQSSWLSEYSS